MKKNDAPANYFFTPNRAVIHLCQAPNINGLQRYKQANLTARQKSGPSFVTAVGNPIAKHREAVLKASPELTETLLITRQEQTATLDSWCQISAAIRNDP